MYGRKHHPKPLQSEASAKRESFNRRSLRLPHLILSPEIVLSGHFQAFDSCSAKAFGNLPIIALSHLEISRLDVEPHPSSLAQVNRQVSPITLTNEFKTFKRTGYLSLNLENETACSPFWSTEWRSLGGRVKKDRNSQHIASPQETSTPRWRDFLRKQLWPLYP